MSVLACPPGDYLDQKNKQNEIILEKEGKQNAFG
jgi:hypothetical protein